MGEGGVRRGLSCDVTYINSWPWISGEEFTVSVGDVTRGMAQGSSLLKLEDPLLPESQECAGELAGRLGSKSMCIWVEMGFTCWIMTGVISAYGTPWGGPVKMPG